MQVTGQGAVKASIAPAQAKSVSLGQSSHPTITLPKIPILQLVLTIGWLARASTDATTATERSGCGIFGNIIMLQLLLGQQQGHSQPALCTLFCYGPTSQFHHRQCHGDPTKPRRSKRGRRQTFLAANETICGSVYLVSLLFFCFLFVVCSF